MSKPGRGRRTPDRHFRAEDELYLPSSAKAKREGRSLSFVLRHALRLYLRNELPLPGDSTGDDKNPPPGNQGTGSGP